MILDTNALSAYLDKIPEAIEVVSGARDLAIPIIVAGESPSAVSPPEQIRKVIGPNAGPLHRSGDWDGDSLALRCHPAGTQGAAGKPIPANDVWIAALSRQYAIPIMSRDTHFDVVGGLRRRTW